MKPDERDLHLWRQWRMADAVVTVSLLLLAMLAGCLLAIGLGVIA